MAGCPCRLRGHPRRGLQFCSVALQSRLISRNVGVLREDAAAADKAIGSGAARRQCFTVALRRRRLGEDLRVEGKAKHKA